MQAITFTFTLKALAKLPGKRDLIKKGAANWDFIPHPGDLITLEDYPDLIFYVFGRIARSENGQWSLEIILEVSDDASTSPHLRLVE